MVTTAVVTVKVSQGGLQWVDGFTLSAPSALIEGSSLE